MREISRSEVEKHRTVNSCWLVIRAKVYDVTAYLHKHPAGVKIMTRSMNKRFDSTEDYDGVVGRFRGHSEHADELLNEYLIGRFVE